MIIDSYLRIPFLQKFEDLAIPLRLVAISLALNSVAVHPLVQLRRAEAESQIPVVSDRIPRQKKGHEKHACCRIADKPYLLPTALLG